MNPGIYTDLPFSEYLALPRAEVANNGGLKLISRSPAHFAAHIDDQSEALEFGRALHLLALEPEKADLVQVGPTKTWGTKAWRAAWEESPDTTLVTPAGMERVHGMADAVRAHEDIGSIMDGGESEVTYIWNDKKTGVPMKSRIDCVRKIKGYGTVILDLKSTEDARPKAFMRAVEKYRYHVQQPLYTDGHEALVGPVKDFLFVAVEKKKPYGVMCYQLDSAWVQRGREQYQEDLKAFARCQETGEWPGYPGGIHKLEMPPWAD